MPPAQPGVTPGVPMAPPVAAAPPQAQYPFTPVAAQRRAGLPWWGWLIASIVGIVIVGNLIGAAVRNSGTPDSGKSSDSTSLQDNNSETAASVQVTPYTNDRVTFSRPARWTQRDLTNNTKVYLDKYLYDRAIFDEPDKQAMLAYEQIGTIETRSETILTDPQVLRDGMQKAHDTYATLSPSQMKAIVEGDGFGCSDNFTYIEQPSTYEENGAIGIRFSYSCGSTSGDSTKNFRNQWYDKTGVRHLMTLSAKPTYWDSHTEEIQTLYTSQKVL